jgi:hypothetical protein
MHRLITVIHKVQNRKIAVTACKRHSYKGRQKNNVTNLEKKDFFLHTYYTLYIRDYKIFFSYFRDVKCYNIYI